MGDMNNSAYKYDDLSGLKRPELNRLAKKLGINSLKGKNEDMIERMIKQSEETKCEYDEQGELRLTELPVNRERKHPVHGKYVKCMVNAREMDVKEDFFADNHYQARIRMGDKIEIPEGFIKFINGSCYSIEHYFDETKYNPETGKMGTHTTRRVPNYYCTLV